MSYRDVSPEAPLLVVGASVTALDRETGAIRWTHDLKGPAYKLALLDDRLFVLDSTSAVFCLDVNRGIVIGTVELGLYNPNALVWDGERIYVSGQEELVALDRSGTVLWRTPLPHNASASKTGLAVPGTVVLQPDFGRV